MFADRKLVSYLFVLLLCMPSPIQASALHDKLVSVQATLEPVISKLESFGEKIPFLKHPHVLSQLLKATVDLETAIEAGIPKHISDIIRIVEDINQIAGAISDGIDNLGPLTVLPPVMLLSTAVGSLSVATKTALMALKTADKALG